MDVFLAYEDSLRMLRHVRQSSELMLSDTDIRPCKVEKAAVDVSFLVRALPRQIFSPSKVRPVSLRFWDDASRSRNAVVRAIPNLGKLPVGSYREVLARTGSPCVAVGNQVAHVFVESPGLSVVSAARTLETKVGRGKLSHNAALVRLNALAMELCGSYVRSPCAPWQDECVYGLEPVGTVAEIMSYVTGAQSLHGLRLARRAVSYANDGSASPMETLWYSAFCLPPRLGGLHLARPLQNVELEWPHEVRERVSHIAMRPDFFWPDHKVAMEYDSLLHVDERALVEDRRRARDYELCGIAYLPVTTEDARDGGAVKAFLYQLVEAFNPHEDRAFRRRMHRILGDAEVDAARNVLLSQSMPPRAQWVQAA